jgi:Spy/CpxP family protein refolding chaperone
MKHPRSVTMVLTALALVGGLAVSLTAFAKPPGRGGAPLSRIESRIETLDLDSETRNAIYAILDEARATHREHRSEVREAKEGLRALLEQDEPDEGAVMEQAEVIGALRTEARKHGLRTLLKVHALLTPEQRASLRETMRDRGGPGFGRGR